jgi:hypothetical protein
MKEEAHSIGEEQGTERKICWGRIHHLFVENLRCEESVKGEMGA